MINKIVLFVIQMQLEVEQTRKVLEVRIMITIIIKVEVHLKSVLTNRLKELNSMIALTLIMAK